MVVVSIYVLRPPSSYLWIVTNFQSLLFRVGLKLMDIFCGQAGLDFESCNISKLLIRLRDIDVDRFGANIVTHDVNYRKLFNLISYTSCKRNLSSLAT